MGNRVLKAPENCKLFGAIRGSSVIWSGGAACLPTRSAGYGDEQGKGKSRRDIAIHRHGNFQGPVRGQHGLGESFLQRELRHFDLDFDFFNPATGFVVPTTKLVAMRTNYVVATTWLVAARTKFVGGGAPHLMLLAAQSLLLLAQSPLQAAQSHLLPQPLPPLTGPPGRIA